MQMTLTNFTSSSVPRSTKKRGGGASRQRFFLTLLVPDFDARVLAMELADKMQYALSMAAAMISKPCLVFVMRVLYTHPATQGH